jgi:N-formylglutamate amidohydrolase
MAPFPFAAGEVIRIVDRCGDAELNEPMDGPLFPLATTACPLTLHNPVRQTVPIVFASPHSGRDYPSEFLAAARLDARNLRRSEDSFVDELFAAAPTYGAPLLAANFPRAFCDANREAWELDPTMFADELPPWVNTSSPRVGAGLGTIARLVASGEAIYREKLPFAEAERRIRTCWYPFHEALQEQIANTHGTFGTCLLIDCHSMPGHGCTGRSGTGAQCVLGDAHGTTCSPRLTKLIEEIISGFGYAVRRNDPYAGGFITRRYGRPRDGIHALQLELARPLYMDEQRIERGSGFPRVQADMTAFIRTLAAAIPALTRAA